MTTAVPGDPQRAIAQLWRAAGRHWFLVATCAVVAALIAGIAGYLQVPEYEARATLLVKFGREYVYRPEVGGFDGWRPSRLSEVINAEVEILASRDLRRQVIAELGPIEVYPELTGPDDLAQLLVRLGLDRALAVLRDQPLPAPPSADDLLDQASKRLAIALEVFGIGESSVIKLAFRHAAADTAITVLDTLLEAFDQRRAQIFAGSSTDFLENQIERFREDLDRAEEALEERRYRSNLFELDAQLQDLLDRATALDDQINSIDRDLEARRKRVAAVEDQLRGLTSQPAYTDAEPFLAREVEGRLAELRLRIARTAGTSGRGAEALLDTFRREERQLVAALAGMRPPTDRLTPLERARLTPLRSQRHQQLTAVADLQVDHQRLLAQLESVKARARVAEHARRDIEDLERQVELARRQYEAHHVRLEEQQLIDALNQARQTNISVIEAPYASDLPVGLPPQAKLVLGGALGLVAGLLIALLREGWAHPVAGPRPPAPALPTPRPTAPDA